MTATITIRATCVLLAGIAVWSVLQATASARPVHPWTMDELRQTSDLIVIGEVVESSDLDAETAVGDIRVATSVRVNVVLSGEPVETVRLIHNRKNPKDGAKAVNDVSRLDFSSGDSKPAAAPGLSIALIGTQYLMFLKLNENGDAEPVSGQSDPDVSVFRLSRATDSPTGLLLRSFDPKVRSGR